LTSFVNAQVVAPLDIQELSATGRDGDFLIAKAAYSLRSLGTRQATLAATGDTVARANGKFVAQVRRSSDDALKSFTADEVTDGTLLAFVNTPTNGVFANTGYESFSNASASGFTASNTSSTGFAVSDILDGVSGDVVSVSFDIDITNGSPSISLRTVLDGGSTASNSATYTSSGSKTATLTATKGYVGIGFTEGDAPSNFTVSNFKIIADGFVKTWYDQSVTNQAGDTATGNHAVQATAGDQPRIVNAGALVVDNGIAGLDFDGTDDFLVTSSVSGLEGPFSMFSTSVRDTTGHTVSFSKSSANNRYFAIQEAASTSIAVPRNSTSGVSVSASVSGADRLTFAVTTGETSTSVGALGGTLANTTDDYGSNFTSISGIDQIAIGLLRTVSESGHFDGRIREIIAYTSDQTDNRTAIEANIGEAYGIDLPSGVDPLNNEVDGFVETWYDQSGNGNDAVQATAGSQPKIVSAGALVTGGLDFDGTAHQLALSNTLGITSAASHFAVTNLNDAGGADILLDNRDSGTDGYSIRTNDTSNINFDWLTSDAEVARISGQSVYYFNKTSSQVQSGANGGTLVTASESGSVSVAVTPRIGARSFISATNFLEGTINELIIYNIDQTDNRTAIEANINSHYSIF
jgi:hypothetical protein